MYEDLKGKRLLVIGSSRADRAIVNTAHQLDMYVICVDGIVDYKKAPAKLLADEAWDINYADTDAVAAKAKEEPVDGVLAGYSEFRVLAACRIAKKLGLPFYATEEQIQLTRNKRTFKDTCVKYGVKVPKDYTFSYPLSREDRRSIEYPVIVKPADYGGRKGITVVNCEAELDEAVEYAISKSESRTLIVEEYLKGTEFAAVYTICNGEYRLSCVNEKYITDDQEKVSGLCNYLISPAYFTDRFIKEADEPLKKFLQGIGAKNGVAFFQGIYSEKGAYVFEMGYRVNGNNDFNSIEYNNGVNFMKMLLNYSVNGTMGEGNEKNTPYYKHFVAALPINLHGGTITKLDYENLNNNENIIDPNCFVKCGDYIPEDGSTNQKGMLIRYTGDSIEDMKKTYDYICENVMVLDEHGKSMLFETFDFSNVEKNHRGGVIE